MMRILILLLSFLLINVSCVKDIDIKQIENSNFQIPVTIALVKTDLTQHDFLDGNNNEVPKYAKLFLIDLDGIFHDDSMDSLELVTQFTNTFDREFVYYLEYLDSYNVRIMTSGREFVPALCSQVIRSEVYEGERLESFADARRINVVVYLLDEGEILDEFNDRELEIQSVINYTIELDL